MEVKRKDYWLLKQSAWSPYVSVWKTLTVQETVIITWSRCFPCNTISRCVLCIFTIVSYLTSQANSLALLPLHNPAHLSHSPHNHLHLHPVCPSTSLKQGTVRPHPPDTHLWASNNPNRMDMQEEDTLNLHRKDSQWPTGTHRSRGMHLHRHRKGLRRNKEDMGCHRRRRHR